MGWGLVFGNRLVEVVPLRVLLTSFLLEFSVYLWERKLGEIFITGLSVVWTEYLVEWTLLWWVVAVLFLSGNSTISIRLNIYKLWYTVGLRTSFGRFFINLIPFSILLGQVSSPSDRAHRIYRFSLRVTLCQNILKAKFL